MEENGQFLASVSRELATDSHVRHYNIMVNGNSTSIRLLGVVPSFYAKQMAQEAVMRLIARCNKEVQVKNELRVEG